MISYSHEEQTLDLTRAHIKFELLFRAATSRVAIEPCLLFLVKALRSRLVRVLPRRPAYAFRSSFICSVVRYLFSHFSHMFIDLRHYLHYHLFCSLALLI